MTATESRDRLFYSLPTSESKASEEASSSLDLLNYVRSNVIGNGKVFSGPFGLRKALYLDYTASGKSLHCIEDYIRNEVLPEYGNTHTTTSVTSLQTTLFRHEARDIVRNAVHASEHDAVIFVGSGSTGAIHKLIHSLDLKSKPIVFVSPFEHHSNLLPWMEYGAKVIRVRSDSRGMVDIGHLENLLKKWQACGRQLIGCFTAASNISGILVDVDTINVCLHKHQALAFWDYATAAPYVKIDMNPVCTSGDQEYMYKDAVFISTHKFVGGVSTPGVLIAKKKLFKNRVPEVCGGGSVFFVRRSGHRYLQEAEMKEEGGTPAIVEAIRAGLVFQLKQAISTPVILSREEQLFRRARDEWRGHKNLILLGNLDVPRLPIFSFMVYHSSSGRFLHHNFVSTLLNDLFGIQARGGCACAGPYAMDLLGLDEKTASDIETLLAEDSRLDRTHLRRYREYSQREIIRPGFTRLNLPYFMNDEELLFTLEAVKLVAEEGWKLLPQYMFNPETGEWRQKNFQVFKDRKWLGHISYSSGEMSYRVPSPVDKGPLPTSYQDCLQKARDLFQQATKIKFQLADHTVMFDEQSKPFRWFLLPSEAADCLKGNNTTHNPSHLPFCPPSLREQLGLPVFVETDMEDDESVEEFLTRAGTVTGISGNSADKPNVGNTLFDGREGEFSEGYEKHINKGFIASHSETDKVEAKSHLANLKASDSSAENKSETAKVKSGDAGQSESSSFGKVSSSQSECRMSSEVSSSQSESSITSKVSSSQSERSISRGVNSTQSETRLSVSETTTSCPNVTVHPTQTVKSDPDNSVPYSTGEDHSVSSYSKSSSTHQPYSVKTNSEEKTKVPKDETFEPDGDYDKTNSGNGQQKSNTSNTDLRVHVSDSPPNVGSPMEKTLIQVSEHESRKRPGDLKSVADPDVQVKRLKDKTEEVAVAVVDPKKRKTKWFSPPKSIFNPFLKAMEEYEMLVDGDRILVCLSGGKDSLSLLHTIRQYQFYCRGKGVKFEMGAVTVDPQTPSYDPSPLKEYLASLGVPYFYESQCILEQAAKLPYECASICSFCSRMKRGRIYACARREGYNVVALGQHLDDLCESFLMSMFHNGILRTMKAHYTVVEGDLRVTRPFVYVREKDLRIFAEKNKLPVIAENCPACFEAPKERHRTKQLLASQEILFPCIFNSMMSAIRPIMAINKTGVKMADILQTTSHDNTSQDDIDI